VGDGGVDNVFWFNELRFLLREPRMCEYGWSVIEPQQKPR